MQNQNHRIVILGAGYSGVLASIRLATRSRDNSADITLINASGTFVERVRLHQSATKQSIKTHKITDLLPHQGVNFVQGWITEINPSEQYVTVDQNGVNRKFSYDTLVYALGSMIDRARVPGIQEHALPLDSIEVAQLAEKIQQTHRNNGKLIVVGGGLTGIETVSEIAETYPGLTVTLVSHGTIGAGLSEKGQNYLHKAFDELGLNAIEGVKVKEVMNKNLVMADGQTIPFDLCIWAGGFVANPLAKQAGIRVNERNQILVDKTFRSVSHPNILAIGDGSVFIPEANLPLRMACATAMPMAAKAADNILNLLDDRPMTDFRFGYVLQCISLGRRRGLVQFVNSDDSPKDFILTGRVGAWVKEKIVQYTIFSMKAEKMLPGSYAYAKGKQTPNAASTLREASNG